VRLLAVLALVAALPGATPAEEAESLGEALEEGQLSLGLRYRFEHVDEDAFDETGDASTLRTLLGYQTRPFHGVSATLRLSNVTDLGTLDRYDDAGAGSTGNGVRDRPVIADPELTRVDQVSLAFERGATRIEGGRLPIALDDQRFVGPVGWRQNTQSFTAARIVDRSIERTELSYAFVERAWTITGGERPMASHLIRAAVELPVGKAVGYAYLLDFDSEADQGASTATWGLRFSGSRPAGGASVRYAAAWAHQGDHGSNPERVSASYYRIDLGVGVPKLGLDAGWEVLEGSPEHGRFTTPLATLHGFNGWADRFLSTPPAGLEDRFLGLEGEAGRLSWSAVFHDFRAQSGGAGYGRELDLQVVLRTSWKQAFGLKAAFYDAGSFSTDTSKVWAWSAWSF
jgi:hypothetical protein